MAWIRATSSNRLLRNGKEAVAEAIKACELTEWKKWAYLDTLAAAYAESDNFDEAVKYQNQALGGSDVPEDNRVEMRKRLELYRQHKPYRTQSKP